MHQCLTEPQIVVQLCSEFLVASSQWPCKGHERIISPLLSGEPKSRDKSRGEEEAGSVVVKEQ